MNNDMFDGTAARKLDSNRGTSSFPQQGIGNSNIRSTRSGNKYTSAGNIVTPDFRNNSFAQSHKNSGAKNGNNAIKNSIENAIENGKQKQMKDNLKNTLPKAAGEAVAAMGMPGGEPLAKAFLDSETGEQLLDEATANASSEAEATVTILQKLRDKAALLMGAGFILSIIGPLILIVFATVILLQAGPTMFWSWITNIFGGSEQHDIRPVNDDDKQKEGMDESISTNPTNNFQTILEAVDERVAELNDQWGVDLDKNLIAATLLGPIDNSTVVEGDGKNKYMHPETGEQVEWKVIQQFLIKQIDFLAKAQIKTVVAADEKKCPKDGVPPSLYWTPMQYAKNDDSYDDWQIWDWLAPWRWFSDQKFARMLDAEKNYKCTLATLPNPNPNKAIIPKVFITSYKMGDIKREYSSTSKGTTADLFGLPKTGGVYFWNLINPEGFIHTYYKAFLKNAEEEKDTDIKYEEVRNRIIQIAEDIYIYYEGMGQPQFCNGYRLLDNKVDKIVAQDPCDSGNCSHTEPEFVEFENPRDSNDPILIPKCKSNSTGTYDIDFYVGGVLSKEFGNASFVVTEGSGNFPEEPVELNGKFYNIEGLKAMAILARTYGISRMGSQGYLENSSNNQNFAYDWRGCVNGNGQIEGGHSNKELIAEAVKQTHGIVLTKFSSSKGKFDIYASEYDAFCPTTQLPKKDGYYYLPNGQRDLPILGKWALDYGLDETWAYCPCFENEGARPNDEYTSTARIGPTRIDSRCWNYAGERIRELDDGTFVTDYRWEYDPSGGHGRGVSQWGMRYYTEKGYDMLEVLKLFSDRSVGDNGRGGDDEDEEEVITVTPVKLMRTTASLAEKECMDVVVDGEGDDGSGGSTGGGTVNNAEPTKTKNILNMGLKAFLDSKEPNGFSNFNAMLKQTVETAGPGTREGVTAYAIALISTLDQKYGVKIPYHWGSGFDRSHSKQPTDYSDDGWGASYTTCPVINSSTGARRCYYYDGMDCSSFVPIAIYNGGYKHMAGGATTLKNKYSMGKASNLRKLSTCNAQPGDVLWHPGHIMLIVGVKRNSIMIAHAKGGDYGVLIEEKHCNDRGEDIIVDMTDWYNQNKR